MEEGLNTPLTPLLLFSKSFSEMALQIRSELLGLLHMDICKVRPEEEFILKIENCEFEAKSCRKSVF